MGTEQGWNQHIPDYADWLEATYTAPDGKRMADHYRKLCADFTADVDRRMMKTYRERLASFQTMSVNSAGVED